MAHWYHLFRTSHDRIDSPLVRLEVKMSDAELKAFLEWLDSKQKQHEELSDRNFKASDAFKLNHESRALAFLEVRAELKGRLALQKQQALEKLNAVTG
jgi:hypothetical protein